MSFVTYPVSNILGSTIEIDELEDLSKGDMIQGDGTGPPSTVAIGTAGQVWTVDLTEPTGAKWATLAPGGGASTALDNLASVAINVSLVSDTDITDNLGSAAIRWDSVYSRYVNTGDTATDFLKLRGWDVDGSAWVDFFTITAANDPTADLSTAVTMGGNAMYYASGTDIPVTDGGTGASDASTARTNLGLAIGTDVQAFDATLTSIGLLGTATDKFAYTTGVDTWAECAITAAGRALLDDGSAAAQRTTLGLAIGTNIQAFDATLTSIAALGTAADKFAYTTGVDTWAEAAITTAGRALIDDATAGDQRTTLGLVIGTNVQAYDATLLSIAALGTAADKITYTTGVDTWAETAITAAGRALIDDATTGDQRTTLGLAIGTNVQAHDAGLDAIAGLTPASRLIIGDGLGSWTVVTPANFITNNNILDTADIGSSVQAYDATLQSISSLGTAADKFAYTTGVNTWAESAITAAGRAILDDADASAQRTTLGLVIGTDVQAYDANTLTTTSTSTLTNKTLDDFSNTISADEIHIKVRNESGGAITIGQVVYISGYSVGQDLPLVSLADADGSGTYPAIGFVEDASIGNNADGSIVTSGRLSGVDTSAFSVGDSIYMSTTAGALSVRPTGATSEVQKVGIVLRSHASLGVVEIIGAGRTNDIPNKMSDAILRIHDDGDDTKLVQFQASGITTATTRTLTVQDVSGTILVTGGSDVAIADGGTGASDASTARTNLGLAIGSNVQAFDATLTSIAALGTAADKLAYTTGVDTWAEAAVTAAGLALLDDANAAAQLTTLGIGNVENTALSTWAGTANIVTVGTIGTGVWQGTAIGAAYLPTASPTASGISELATAAEITTGTDTGRTITPDAFAGSDYGKRVVSMLVFSDADDMATGDGAGDLFWRVPSVLNGYNLVAVAASVKTAGTTGTADIQVINVTDGVDMLSTKITIDSGETDSSTAATPAVINTSNDDVATGDSIRFDVDSVHTTPAKGLLIEMIFQKP
jgi:hypothetical protein